VQHVGKGQRVRQLPDAVVVSFPGRAACTRNAGIPAPIFQRQLLQAALPLRHAARTQNRRPGFEAPPQRVSVSSDRRQPLAAAPSPPASIFSAHPRRIFRAIRQSAVFQPGADSMKLTMKFTTATCGTAEVGLSVEICRT
jgi:hypothetical protein